MRQTMKSPFSTIPASIIPAILLAAAMLWLDPGPCFAQTLAGQAGASAVQSELAGDAAGEGKKKQQKESAKSEQENPPAEGEENDLDVAFVRQARTLHFSILIMLKLLLMFLVVLMWVGAGDWVNRDSQIHKLGWHKWNPWADCGGPVFLSSNRFHQVANFIGGFLGYLGFLCTRA